MAAIIKLNYVYYNYSLTKLNMRSLLVVKIYSNDFIQIVCFQSQTNHSQDGDGDDNDDDHDDDDYSGGDDQKFTSLHLPLVTLKIMMMK